MVAQRSANSILMRGSMRSSRAVLIVPHVARGAVGGRERGSSFRAILIESMQGCNKGILVRASERALGDNRHTWRIAQHKKL